MSSSTEAPRDPLSLVVLISGRGSNLQAIIDALGRERIPARVSAVVSNRRHAGGLALAAAAGIPTRVIDRDECRNRDDFDARLSAQVRALAPDLIVLAGFMHILNPDFVQAYDGRMINIHPSLLPDYPGLRTHERALAAGAREHGASVHYVTEELDGGPVILQGRIPVSPRDDAAALAAKVLEVEHRIYPLTIRLIAEGRLRKRGADVLFDGHRLERPLDLADFATTDPHDAGARVSPAT